MGTLSNGCERAADLEESVSDGIVQFHFADVFALEDMVITGVKRNTTVAAGGEKGWGQAGEAELALQGDGEDVIGRRLCGMV